MPKSRKTIGFAAVTRMATPAAAAANPVEPPTEASNFRLAMGVLHAQGR